MKRILLFVLSFVITASITFTASAENITLSAKLARAVQDSQLKDEDGNTITATLISPDTISLSMNAPNAGAIHSGTYSLSITPANVASINFDTADLSGLTSFDFGSLDMFTELKELKITLPASYSGDFAPSFDRLRGLDLSGSAANFTLSLYYVPRIVSVNASGCSNLKAVNLALVRSAAASTDLPAPNMSGVKTVSKVIAAPLSSLETLDLSNTPKLNRAGYALDSEISITINNGIVISSFDSINHTFGCIAHHVTTTVKKGTTFKAEETSYPAAVGRNVMTPALGGTGSEIAQYIGDSINLTPALRIINLKNSGIDASDYISTADVSEASLLASADFSGMTSLYDLAVPSSSALKSLNLTGDTGLSILDLSGNMGFIWPQGFKTLTGLTDFKMTGRSEIDSIDITPFTQLKTLDLTKDSIEALDVSNNLMLESIIVPNNKIQSLDFSRHERIKSLDIRNNSLVAIDLSKNINIRVNSNSSGNAAISISPQTRYMTGSRSRTFSFRDLGMSSLEAARVVMDSVKGGGVAVESYDALSNTVTFKAAPSVIEYDYDSGLYYEGSTTPLCMKVRLIWDVSGRKPALTPTASAIRGKAKSGAVTPVTITADSETPVTWTTSPANMPAGLSKSFTDWTLTISGEPTEAYSGVVTVTARNVNGDSDPATVSIAIESASVTPTPTPTPTPDPEPSIPVLSLSASTITGTADGSAITPVTITTKSDSAVTWTTSPDIMPAGLEKIINGLTLTVSGEPIEAYSGSIIVTAENDYGTSDSVTVSVEITDAPSPSRSGVSGSGGGGCSSGVISMAGLALAFAVMLRRH